MSTQKRQSPLSDEERKENGQPAWEYETPWGILVVYRWKRYQANQHFARVYKRESERYAAITEEAEETLNRIDSYVAERHRIRRQEDIANGVIPLDERTLFDII